MQRVIRSLLSVTLVLACTTAAPPENKKPADDTDVDAGAPDTRKMADARMISDAPAQGGTGGGDAGPAREELFTEQPATLPAPVSGTRLKVMLSQPVDGPEVLRGWFDQTRQEQCIWEQAADGVLRCQPANAITTNEPSFADPACTKRAIVKAMNAACPGPAVTYVRTTRASCPPAWTIARLGEKLAVTTLYYPAGGNCVARPALRADQEAFAVGDEVPPAMFAGGKLTAGDAKGGRLAPVFLEGEDGSRVFASWRDTTTGADCFSSLSTDGTVRCLPGSLPVVAFLRSEATCTAPAVISPKTTCTDADKRVLVQTISSQCPTRVTVTHLTGKLTGAFTQPAGGQCMPATVVNDAVDIWGVDAQPVDPGMFAPTTWGVTGGSTRLRARTEGTAAGIVMLGSFWDAKLHARCGSTTAADGVIRCLPQRLGTPVYYEDAACTGPPSLVLVGNGECQVGYVERTENVCPPRAHVNKLGDPYLGATFRQDAQRGCIRVTANPGFQAYRVGAEVPAAEFVEVRRP
jgi:hypothetical protein